MTNIGSAVALSQVVGVLEELLCTKNYTDHSWNGLQVEANSKEVSRVGLAVDTGLSVIEAAVQQSCDLLIAHHGLFWGNCAPTITGPIGLKVRTLLSGGCSLYVSHLPLDGNLRFGNAAELARALALTDITAAFDYEGATIGITGMLPHPLSKEQFPDFVYSRVIPSGQDSITCSLLFGPDKITKVGVATGSASSLIPMAKELNCDGFISGEPKHESYHVAKEEQVNAVFAGHYFTETYGVRAIGNYLADELKITTVFLDEPTGI